MIECTPAQAEKNFLGNIQKHNEKITNINQMQTVKDDKLLRSYVEMYQSTYYLDDSDLGIGANKLNEKMDKSSKNRSKSAHYIPNANG